MAISINQIPGDYVPVNNQMIISVTSSNSNPNLITFNGYRFTIQLSDSNTFNTFVTGSQIKKYPDSNGESYLDVQRIVSNYVSFDFDYTSLLWTQCLTKDKFVRIGVEEDWIDINGNQTFSSYTQSDVFRAINARIDLLDYIDWRTNVGGFTTGWLDNDLQLIYSSGTSSNNFELTPVPLDEYKVGPDDRGVLHFLQDPGAIQIANRFPIRRLVIESYNSNDVLLYTRVKTYDYGTQSFPNQDDKLLSIFSGPAQISDINVAWRLYSATQSAGAVSLQDPLQGASYYYLYVEYSEIDSFTGILNFQRNSRKIKYKLESYCYDYYRIAWLNSLSGWDFFNFDGRPDITKNVERSEYNKIQDYNYTINTLGGNKNYNSRWNTTIQTNSNWVSQEEGFLIETLFESPVVFLQRGNEFIPINIITDSVKRWTDVDDLFLYQFQFTFQNSEYYRA